MATSALEEVSAEALTLDSAWRVAVGDGIDEELLQWPPDVFALTEVLLERSGAYRFAMSPPAGAMWPPERMPDWDEAMVDAGRQWGAWAEDQSADLPALVASAWAVLIGGAATPLARLSDGIDWRLCEALLTLHAVADEACAGLGIATEALGGKGSLYRARARELLARTGSVARCHPQFVRVIPKLRTPPTGTSLRSLSRYACVTAPSVDVRWHKVPARRPGTEPHVNGVNCLLLPWPLRVRESDFRPLAGSVRGQIGEQSGFFEFVPSERLDLDLVDRMLVASRDEAGQVNVVVLPESAVDHREIDDLESLLRHHGVPGLIAGVRQPSEQADRFAGNWVHIGVLTGNEWVHVHQSKHNRWSLDQAQVRQYHLSGALHPHVRWWEAMEVPRRSIQLVEFGEGATIAALVCEDLAQSDEVAGILRSVGPMVVVTPLLDGPQLSSRWAARYASVLADDPGSAVLTLTSYGMARRSRPNGRDPSSVIGLWKDPGRGIRQIPLEPGAQGVLISASADRTMRRSSDGRSPVQNGGEFFDMSIFQVRAASTGSYQPDRATAPPRSVLAPSELTILTSWAEAVAEALVLAPGRAATIAAQARSSSPWRGEFSLPDPAPALDRCIRAIHEWVRSITDSGQRPSPEALLSALSEDHKDRRGDSPCRSLARRVLRSAIEQRQMRCCQQPSG